MVTSTKDEVNPLKVDENVSKCMNIIYSMYFANMTVLVSAALQLMKKDMMETLPKWFDVNTDIVIKSFKDEVKL